MDQHSEAVLELLHDEHFLALRRRSTDDFLTWDQFASMTMPSGYSAEATWRILTAIRKQTAYCSPIPDYMHESHGDIWCSTDGITALQLKSVLEREFRESSWKRTSASGARERSRQADILYALRLDGVLLDAERLSALYERTSGPTTAEETIAVNLIKLTRDIPALSRHRITSFLARDLSFRLSEGCSVESISEPILDNDYLNPWATSEKMLADVCETIEGAPLKSNAHGLVDVLTASGVFWDFRLVEHLNACVELLLRQCALYRMSAYRLADIPLSEFAYAWLNDLIPRVQIPFRWWNSQPDCGEGWDITPFILLFLRLSLDEMESQDREESLSSEELTQRVASIRRMGQFNYRQQDILIAFVSHQLDEITIKQHIEQFTISYATGRSDLLALCDFGYLQYRMNSKEMVFAPSDKLPMRELARDLICRSPQEQREMA